MASAAIQRARVWVQEGPETLRKEFEMPVLLYPRRALEIDGGMAIRLLKLLGPKLPETHGVFGTFKDYGSLRGHLLQPQRRALDGFQVWDWGFVEILPESLVKLEFKNG